MMRGPTSSTTKQSLNLSLVYLINFYLFCGLFCAALENNDANSKLAATYELNERRQPERLRVKPLTSDDSELTVGESYANDADNDFENEIAEHSNDEENTFDWLHHKEDHGIYSGRALMSAENLKLKHKTTDEDEDEEEESLKIERGKKEENIFKLDNDELQDPLKTIDFAEKEWQLMFRSFDSAADSLSSTILQEIGRQTNLFEDIINRLEPKCRRDINHIRDSIKKHKLWALRMVDSNGKLPSGITYGRFSSPGDYEECISVRVDEKVSKVSKDAKKNLVESYKFHGKYCLIDFRLPLPERPPNKLLSIHESVLNFTGTELEKQYPDLIRNYSSYASVFYEVGYMHAFCLPSSCDVFDVSKSMGKALEGIYLIVNSTVDCEERPDEPVPLRKSQWIAIAILFIVFANAFLASLAHYLLPKEVSRPTESAAANQRRKSLAANSEQKEKAAGKVPVGGYDLQAKVNELKEKNQQQASYGPSQGSKLNLLKKLKHLSLKHKFYSDCFSVQKNFERLTKPDPRGLTFVHYTRIVAMALTVITHTGALGTLQAITKPADASNSESIFRDFIPQMLANAFTSIQIFFFMAGFMLVISTYPSIKRDKGHVSFLEYAVKRAIRLLPGILATICLNFIWPLLVDGPMLRYFDRIIVEPCETTWWHTMAFLSNFDHVEKMCLRHSYFSASDYQLHIVAFPILILLYKQPTLALFLAALLTVSGFVAQIIMILTKNVLPFMMVDYIDKEAFFNVIHYIHHPVWNHMSAFFYGFIVGYLVVKQARVNLSQIAIKRLWYIIMPAGIASIFAPYFWNHYKRPILKWQMVLYVIFDRFILLSTCAWLSYATMVLGREPPAKKAQVKSNRPIEASKQTPQLAGDQRQIGGSTLAGIKSPIEQVLSKTQASNLMGSFDCTQLRSVAAGQPTSLTAARLSSGSLTSLPRQRSSPNLQQQQLQQVTSGQVQQLPSHQQQQLDISKGLNLPSGRLSRTVSSCNLATIEEIKQQAADGKPPPASDNSKAPATQQQARPRNPPPVSNINVLCLVLSRLTFQLYLFNMVVLCIDVNHSKYYWFFSYYFIIVKATSVYICSAILAMIFFVTMESPSLTLYIAWVKGRAAARSRSMRQNQKVNIDEIKISVPLPPFQLSASNSAKVVEQVENTGVTTIALNQGRGFDNNGMLGDSDKSTTGNAKPTFSFIDLSSAKPVGDLAETKSSVDQTKM